ncbi:MAG TPA: UDP-N-acetylmuramate dehydrogenase [Candidatus Onthousia faecigallinarum]|nr:UDP-N-acetylmuramate dehydrogenase [Candidatus Onthousia faecigallinarum]
MKAFLKEVEKKEIGKIVRDVFLSKYTAYKVGGIATVIIYPKNQEKLVALCKLIRKYHLKYKILGFGSNLLFSDKRYKDVLIKLDEFNKIEFVGNKVICGAGASLMKVSKEAAKRSLTGLEFAAGIPGSIGGAIYMNAGAYKSDMGYIVQSVTVLTDDLRIITLTNQEMDFHYRSSLLQREKGFICLEAVLKLVKGDRKEIENVLRERKERRLASQPLEYPSAGSVFRNPEGMFAGKMIEDIGLKGLTKGGAQVSEKHANFIINKNEASAKDIHDLILFVQEAVEEHYHIKLKVEQEFVNWE